MNKILPACIGVLVLAMHVSSQGNSTTSNSTNMTSSTTMTTMTSSNVTNHTSPSGGGSSLLPVTLNLLLPIILLWSVLHGHF